MDLSRVDLHFVVKVSDFGLSESIKPSKDYFRQQEEGVKLPFKWMSPESLVDGMFSEKTDVVCVNDFCPCHASNLHFMQSCCQTEYYINCREL